MLLRPLPRVQLGLVLLLHVPVERLHPVLLHRHPVLLRRHPVLLHRHPVLLHRHPVLLRLQLVRHLCPNCCLRAQVPSRQLQLVLQHPLAPRF